MDGLDTQLGITVIGSFPKPDFLTTPDWFHGGAGSYSVSQLNEYVATNKTDESALRRAAQHVMGVQAKCGCHVVTDGEVRRENYIHHFCRGLEGIDFVNLEETSCRNNAYVVMSPVVVGPISRPTLTCAAEWQSAQDQSLQPVKFTLPGPLTTLDTVAAPKDETKLARAMELAEALNAEIRALVEAGCTQIQVDEPVFARQPEAALDWGIKLLDVVFAGVPPSVVRTVHICCGYPDHLDQTDYLKADRGTYCALAPALESSGAVDVISLEDAHLPNDLAALLPLFKTKTIAFGCVAVARSRVETPDEIERRLRDVLQYIPAERLLLAPDCGLAFLPEAVAEQKLQNMAVARERILATLEEASTSGGSTDGSPQSTESI